MLHKQRSKKTAVLKYGLFLPLFAITLVMSSATIRSNENIIAVTEEIPLNTPLEVVKEVISAPIDIAVSNMKREAVKRQDVKDPAWEGFYNYLKRGIRYPAEAYRADLQGNSQVKFNLKEGHIGAISVVDKLGSGFETEIMRIVLSYKDFKSSQDGNYSLPVSFILSGATTPKKNPKLSPVKGHQRLSTITVMGYKADPKNTADAVSNQATADPNDVKVYDFVSIDRQPTFPGGMQMFYAYLSKSVKYPAEAHKNNVQGKVYLSFIVEKSGELAEIKVERKLGAGTDEEAVRVLKESPKWIPGIYNGNAVRVKYNIPINFTLTGNAPSGDKTGLVNKTDKVTFTVTSLPPAQGDQTLNKYIEIPEGKKPLIVLDGKRTEIDVNEINPDNIASIEILKNSAATALYGTAAFNGVILITTKNALKAAQKENRKD